MIVFLQLIHKYEFWLFGLCGLVFLYYIRRAWYSRQDRAGSFFALEKEVATSNLLRSLGGALFCCLIAGGIYYVNDYVISGLELPEVLGAEPTPFLFPTPIPTPTQGPPAPSPTLTPTRRTVHTLQPTLTPQATPTPRIVPPSCPDPGAQLTSPGVNEVLHHLVEVRGVAQIEDFDYYKFEFRGADTEGEWAFLQRHDQSIAGGVLGTWDVSMLANGEYEFRVVVVRRDGNYKLCATRVIVQH